MQQDQNKENLQKGQQGSGSAENTGRSREDQKNQSINLSETERQDIASQTGISTKDIGQLKDLGAYSGREDYSGGDRDGMRDENSDERTDR